MWRIGVGFWMGALQWVDLPKLTRATVGLYAFWFSLLIWWPMGSQWHMGFWCQVHFLSWHFSIFCDSLWKMRLMFTLWFSSAIRSKFQCSIAAAATVGSITSGNPLKRHNTPIWIHYFLPFFKVLAPIWFYASKEQTNKSTSLMYFYKKLAWEFMYLI